MEQVEEGDTVVLRFQDEPLNIMFAIGDTDQRVGKSRIATKSLIGFDYNSLFQVNDRNLELIYDQEIDLDNLLGDMDKTDNLSALKKGDNRLYVDTNTAQKLQKEDIQSMKSSGVSGSEIIKNLIVNSDTWSSKTEFSQEKWLKRKQKKYMRTARVVKAAPISICDVLRAKNHEKVCGIRWDVLSQLLNQSGIYSGCKVLVFESMSGLIVGSVAYRLRGNGSILAAYSGQQPHYQLLSSFNLDESSLNVIQPVPSNELGPAVDNFKNISAKNSEVGLEFSVKKDHAGDVNNSASIEIINQDTNSNIDQLIESNKVEKIYNSTGRNLLQLERSRLLLRDGVNRLIIASKFHPLPILKESIMLLTPSSPFVVYCEFVEPLVECYMYLQQFSLAIKLNIYDTWTREFQTLPGRVHPSMFMSNSGGFLLSGIRIIL